MILHERDQHQILAIGYIFRTEILEWVQEGGNSDHESARKQKAERKIKATAAPLSDREAWESRKTFQSS